MGLPCISLAREIKVEDGTVLAKKNIPVGYEQVRAKMPALVTVSNEIGELRYISRTKMMQMVRKARSIPSWTGEDFLSGHQELTKMDIVELSSPPDMSRNCEFIEGTPEEKADRLVSIFKELQ
jgi:electron transfer flavoprotein beta subunit